MASKKSELKQLPIRSFDYNKTSMQNINFEISELESRDSDSEYWVEAHRHDYYHILYVVKGSGEHRIDFKTYKIEDHSLFFISPGQVHSMKINAIYKAYVITFDHGFYYLNNQIQHLIDYPFFYSLSSSPSLYLKEKNSFFEYNFSELCLEYQTYKTSNPKLLRALLELILCRALKYCKSDVLIEDDESVSYQVKNLEILIETHYKEFKLLSDYANMLFVSAKHLNTLCKKTLNKTVTNLIHERLILEAKRLLLFTNSTVAEIAYELGFKEKSYFMRFFKNWVGCTADNYRKKNKDKS
ncbi:MAG: AraC family transcriptional regulator [Marinifilaceae bacterium]|jgi:AraC-like DNA-binding protein|nr:AraC family transcriptional regulator [Marinifilaceae bacterium]